MATTTTDLFRSVMGDAFKKIKEGVYPGDGILDPRWEDTQRFVKKTGQWKTDFADVTIVAGKDGPEVQTGGGTSLHDVAGWFPGREFHIPVGTEYSDEIYIRKDDKRKTSPATAVSGHHYQLEPKTQMTVLAFKGYLDNMARAAVARQVALAKG
jgi:Tse2 ADP-ribosyltransferase toxins